MINENDGNFHQLKESSTMVLSSSSSSSSSALIIPKIVETENFTNDIRSMRCTIKDDELKPAEDCEQLMQNENQQLHIQHNTTENMLQNIRSENNRMQIAIDVLFRILVPVFNGVARGWRHGLRGINILRSLKHLQNSRQMLTHLLAYAANSISLSLSTVQVRRIDPLLKIIKFKKNTVVVPNNNESITATDDCNKNVNINIKIPRLNLQTYTYEHFLNDTPEKSVVLNVLAEPPMGTPIRADVIFIHGLHGSLVNTWKQGLWNRDGRRVNFERPPKPPIRPPKRPRHSRTTSFDPPHQSKRQRFNENDTNISLDLIATDYFMSGHRSVTKKIRRRLRKSKSLSIDYNSDKSLDIKSNAYDNHNNNNNNNNNNGTNIDNAHQCNDLLHEEVNDIKFIDDVEYSFPIYRLCLNDIENELKNSVPDENSVTTTNNMTTKNTTSTTTTTTDENPNLNNNTLEKNTIYSKCWPGDWLPIDCPGVRVIALNYTTDPYLWRPIWVKKRNRTSLTERSREMAELLMEKSVGVGHPIIWVGHSKGGIFIKQMLVDAFENGKTSTEPLWRSSRGILFYSVPHRGSPLADFNLPLLRHSIELTEIKKNSPALLELHRRFVSLYMSGNLKIQIFSFIETALTFMSVLYLRIVGIDSADPGIGEVCGVHLDHREICKPRNRNCILYTALTKMIKKVS